MKYPFRPGHGKVTDPDPTREHKQLTIEGEEHPFPRPLPLSPAAMRAEEFQMEVAAWAIRNFDPKPSAYVLLGVIEELGEICRAVLKREQHIRPEDTTQDKIADEVGDVLIYLANFCSLEGINMGVAANKKWAKVRQRDWRADPERGGQA